MHALKTKNKTKQKQRYDPVTKRDTIFMRCVPQVFLQKKSLHEKFDLHQIYSVQIWCKKVQTKVK